MSCNCKTKPCACLTSSKICPPAYTGDIKFDGTTLDCTGNFTITNCENLNTVIATLGTALCTLYTNVSNLDGLNLGSGEGVFAQRNGDIFEFKSIVGGDGISVSSTATEVTVSANLTSSSGEITIVPSGGALDLGLSPSAVVNFYDDVSDLDFGLGASFGEVVGSPSYVVPSDGNYLVMVEVTTTLNPDPLEVTLGTVTAEYNIRKNLVTDLLVGSRDVSVRGIYFSKTSSILMFEGAFLTGETISLFGRRVITGGGVGASGTTNDVTMYVEKK
jgi:hypothetical protein